MDKNIFDKLVPEYVQKLNSDEVTDLLIEISNIAGQNLSVITQKKLLINSQSMTYTNNLFGYIQCSRDC